MIRDVRIADDRVKDGKDDKYDVNVSSIGHYPFATMHQNSGIKMNGNWTSGSGYYYKLQPKNLLTVTNIYLSPISMLPQVC